MIVIPDDGIINEKAKPVRYNESKIYDYKSCAFDDEELANNQCADNEVVRKIKFYAYECAFWAHDNIEGGYITDYVHDESPLSMTKIDMRAFLANSARELIGFNYDILGVHDCKKEEKTLYCVIAESELEKCIIK